MNDEQARELYRKVLWHKLRYITRPTFTVYQEELAKKLKNYRNSSVWGRFRELSYEEVEAMAKKRENNCKVSQDLILLESGHCPKCGGRIRWLSGLFPGTLSHKATELGNGYFELSQKIRGSPNRPDWSALKEALRWKKRFLAQQVENVNNWLESEKSRVDIYG